MAFRLRMFVCLSLLAAGSVTYGQRAPGGAVSSVEVHYAPDEDLAPIDQSLIIRCRDGMAINAALYVATNYRVLSAFADAARTGCRVRL